MSSRRWPMLSLTLVAQIALPGCSRTENVKTVQPGALETVRVVVARENLFAGTSTKEPEGLFRTVRYVKGDVPDDAVTNLAMAKNRILCTNMVSDQPLRNTYFEGPTNFLAEGYRAIGIRVPEEGLIGGFVLPGLRVDVIASEQVDGKSESEILLQDVKVLGIQSYFDATRKKDTPYMAALAVKPEEALKPTEAAEKGKLTLALRWPDGL